MAPADEWARRVAAWQASGLTAAEFAEGKGYQAGTLRWWSSELRRRGRRKSAGTKSPAEGRSGDALVRMARVLPRRAVLEATKAELLVRVGGAEVAVRRGFDAGLLKEVVSALGGGA